MTRRQALAALAGSAVAAGAARRIALTIDDFSWEPVRRALGDSWQTALLSTLADFRWKAAAFVIGENALPPEGRDLIRAWGRAGHRIGNHTHTHRPYHRSTFEQFSADFLEADRTLAPFPGFEKWFRFPMLREGETAAKRDRMREFLARHGYRNAYVTIDNADWYIASRFAARLQTGEPFDRNAYRDYYLRHLWDRATYYDQLALKVFGRPIPHTLLIHYNVLNAYFLGDVLRHFAARGWTWIDAREAFSDPAFRSQPAILPAGESLAWAVAKEKNLIGEIRYPAEDGEYIRAEMDRLKL